MIDPYAPYVWALLLGGSLNSTDPKEIYQTMSILSGTVTDTADAAFPAGRASSFVSAQVQYVPVLSSVTPFSIPLSAGELTVEYWARFRSLPASGNSVRMMLAGVNDTGNAYTIGVMPDGSTYATVPQGTTTNMSAAGVVTVGTTDHWAFTLSKSANMAWIFKNGAVVYSGTAYRIPSGDTARLWVGRDTVSTVNAYFDGLMSDFRLTVGVARYTAPFTPPSALVAETVGAVVTDGSAVRLPPLSAPPTSRPATSRSPVPYRNLEFGGTGYIAATVKEKNTPANTPLRRKVRLHREFDGMLIAETWSDDAGNYAFVGIDPRWRYTIVSYDYASNYRAVIADNLPVSGVL